VTPMCLVTLSSISAQRTHAAAHAGRFRRQQLPAVWTGRSTTCACACWLTLASIALCHLLCSVPKAQQAIHMLLRACLLFTVISLVAAYSVRPRSEISCNGKAIHRTSTRRCWLCAGHQPFLVQSAYLSQRPLRPSC